MAEYRKVIKEHFESIEGFKKVLDVDYIFWGLGLALVVLGGCLAFVAYIAGSVLSGIGIWVLYFGMVLAFIKKNDLGLLISTGGMAIYSFVIFIVMVASRVFDMGTLMNILCFGVLFILAYRVSEYAKQAELKRAQQAAVLARQAAEAGAKCPKCGAVMAAGAAFCQTCGAKMPEEKLCPSCGAKLAADAEFCTKCGAKAAAKAETASVCPSCGTAITPEDAFCIKCGTKLK